MRYLIRFLLKFVIAVVVLIVPVSWIVTQISLHHIPRIANVWYRESPADYDIVYQDVQLESKNGAMLSGWYMPGENGAGIVVVHGYRSVKTHTLKMLDPLSKAGYTILAIDLRAHGESDHHAVTFGIEEQHDVNAAVAWLKKQASVDPERIGVLGESMGGAAAILATADNPTIKAVAAQSAFASMHGAIETRISHLLLGISYPLTDLMIYFGERQLGVDTNDYAPVKLIGQIAPRPIFLMQGGKDRMVDPTSGHQLYEAAGEPKTLWYEPTLRHINFPHEKPEEFNKRITAFFDAALSISG